MPKKYQLRFVLLLTCILFAAIAKSQATEVTIKASKRGAVVQVDGEFFAEYLTRTANQPAIWPIYGPTGKPMTRSYPVGPLLETENKDHPHHRSLWFAHENVNGYNFWAPQGKPNVIEHLAFDKLESADNEATLVARNRWVVGEDNVICEDRRTVIFGADESARWIDFKIEIHAVNGPVTFGDVKDGTFSTRVAGTMKADSGGTLVNSVGQKNADAWGMPAEWIDNYGPVDGETVGLAMFNHPSNFRHPCRWHVRTYGLLCANPFGERQFPPADIKQSGYTIDADETLTLRYRVYLHRGDTEQGEVAKAYHEFASQPQLFGQLPVLVTDDFEQGVEQWVASDAKLPESVWLVEQDSNDAANHYLRVTGTSKYQPPHRSPHSIYLLKNIVVEDFEMTVDVQNTNVDAGGHRDLCFFWGYQDPAHFYYAHLGAEPDLHSSQIFIVNDAPRTMITENDSPGIPWTNGWHRVKVRYQHDSGRMQVFFDDMTKPVFVATDNTFTWGRVGIGTFDDNGNFDNFELRGTRIQPIPAAAKLP